MNKASEQNGTAASNSINLTLQPSDVYLLHNVLEAVLDGDLAGSESDWIEAFGGSLEQAESIQALLSARLHSVESSSEAIDEYPFA